MPYTVYANVTRNPDPIYYDGYYPTGRPPAGAVTIDWDGVHGFGSPPNIVLFRDFTEKDLLSTINVNPVGDEVGILTNDSTVSLPIIRDLLTGGFRGLSMHEVADGMVQKKLRITYPEHQRFRHVVVLGSPKGSFFPGDTVSAPATFSVDSSLKVSWDLWANDSNSNNDEYDKCMPTKTDNANFAVAGNSSTLGGIGNGVDNWAFSEVADGEFGNMNTFDYLADCDLLNSVSNPVAQSVQWTSPKINANKTTGTKTYNFNVPFAQNTGGGTVVNGVKDKITITKYNPFFEVSTIDPTKTNLLIHCLYRTIQSIPGVSADYKQTLYRTNGSTMASSTIKIPCNPTTWGNIQVSAPAKKWWQTYYIVVDENNFETAKAV